MRAKCIIDVKKLGSHLVKDPDITKNNFYEVTEKDVRIMGNEDKHIKIIGDCKKEVTRASHLFKLFYG